MSKFMLHSKVFETGDNFLKSKFILVILMVKFLKQRNFLKSKFMLVILMVKLLK